MKTFKILIIVMLGLSVGSGLSAAEKKERKNTRAPKEREEQRGKAEEQSRGTRDSRDSRERGDMRAGQERHGMTPGVAPEFMRLFAVLNIEQRASLRDVIREHHEKAGAAEQKIAKARRQLMESSLREKFDENAIRKQAHALGQMEADRAVWIAKAISQINPPLSKEQKRRLSEPTSFRRDMGQFGPPQRGFERGKSRQSQPPPAFRGGDRFSRPGMFGPGPGPSRPMFRERFRESRQNQQFGSRDGGGRPLGR